MAIDLLALEPQQISRNLKGKFSLFYGAPGVGKTTLASKFEKSLILGCEAGTNALNNVYVQPIKTWQDMRQVVSQLTRNEALKEKFYTIVIDTADEAFKLCERWSCNQAGVETVKDIAAFGGGYKIVDDNFMAPFRELAYAGYGLIFISHETEKPYTDDNGKEYNKIVPALPNRPFQLINKMVDIIGYIREIPIQKGDTIERERFVFFRGDERFLSKSRFKYITPKIHLDYNEFVNAIYNAVDEEVKHSGGEATNDENPYLVKDFDYMMDEAKQVWGKVVQAEKTERALAILNEEFGKPTKFSEILPDQINQFDRALTRIKELV